MSQCRCLHFPPPKHFIAHSLIVLSSSCVHVSLSIVRLFHWNVVSHGTRNRTKSRLVIHQMCVNIMWRSWADLEGPAVMLECQYMFLEGNFWTGQRYVQKKNLKGSRSRWKRDQWAEPGESLNREGPEAHAGQWLWAGAACELLIKYISWEYSYMFVP